MTPLSGPLSPTTPQEKTKTNGVPRAARNLKIQTPDTNSLLDQEVIQNKHAMNNNDVISRPLQPLAALITPPSDRNNRNG